MKNDLRAAVQLLLRAAFFLCLLLGTTACSSLPSNSEFGSETSVGGLMRLKSAALDAAMDPQTWVPLAGALLLSAGGWDNDISEWAIRETPLFGSGSTAEEGTDDLRSALALATLTSVLSAPG